MTTPLFRYGRAKELWARWAARARQTNDPHAKHVMELCAHWMLLERIDMKLPSPNCRSPALCIRQTSCPLELPCDG